MLIYPMLWQDLACEWPARADPEPGARQPAPRSRLHLPPPTRPTRRHRPRHRSWSDTHCRQLQRFKVEKQNV
jgi:hypothetical protein